MILCRTHNTKYKKGIYYSRVTRNKIGCELLQQQKSTHHLTKLLTSVIYIMMFITEKRTNYMGRARLCMRFMFSSTQEQQHQTPENVSSCYSFL
jgi:hypothetical protein